jgi:hypothetical protein
MSFCISSNKLCCLGRRWWNLWTSYIKEGCWWSRGCMITNYCGIKSTRRAQQESRRGCAKCLSISSRPIWLFQCINRRTSLGLLLHHLVVHCAKWNCPLACHPPTGTVHVVSGLCQRQTPRNYKELQQSEMLKFKSQIAFSLFFLPYPRLVSSLSTAFTWLKVLRVGNCIPLSVQKSRALYQVTFLKQKNKSVQNSGS